MLEGDGVLFEEGAIRDQLTDSAGSAGSVGPAGSVGQGWAISVVIQAS